MRLTPLLTLAVLALGFSSLHAQSAQGPRANQAPTFLLDEKGEPRRIDFGLSMRPVSNASLDFSQFQGRKMILYYFSAKCPHCQTSVGHVQRLADELAPRGYSSMALAIRFNSEDEIRGFIRDYGVRMPVMQDINRTFGDNYGVGTIPVVYLINEKGEFIRYSSFNYHITPGQIREAALSWIEE